MYLQAHPKKKKDDIYNYYSLAESYREDGKSKKRIISYLGKLTPEKAQQIRNVLKISLSTDTIVTTIDDLLLEDHWHYLDIAFLNHLWENEWGLSELFPLPEETSKNRKKDISTCDIAKILTFYRCLDPGSYLNAVDWFKTTSVTSLLELIKRISTNHEYTVNSHQSSSKKKKLSNGSTRHLKNEIIRVCEWSSMIFPTPILRGQNVSLPVPVKPNHTDSKAKGSFFHSLSTQKVNHFHGIFLKITLPVSKRSRKTLISGHRSLDLRK